MSIAFLLSEIYGHLKILQIWLKTPIPPQKVALWGFYPYTLLFCHRDPIRHFLPNEPPCVKIGSTTFAVGDDKNNNRKERKGKAQKVRKSL